MKIHKWKSIPQRARSSFSAEQLPYFIISGHAPDFFGGLFVNSFTGFCDFNLELAPLKLSLDSYQQAIITNLIQYSTNFIFI